MPPITYTSERFGSNNNDVHTQQPISTNNVTIVYQHLHLGPGKKFKARFFIGLFTVVYYIIEPMLITCPNCQKNVTTKVDYQSGDATHSCALLLCFMGCDSCVCLPYCMDSMKDALHYCPECRVYLGKHCPK